MKKIIFLVAVAMLCMSCEDFLDTENLTKRDTSTFPQTQSDAEQMITGIYSTLNRVMRNPHNSYHLIAELVSDDRLGGGGENDMHFQAVDKLMNVGPDQYQSYWEDRYRGIFRANTALETLDNCDVNEETLNRFKAEAHFLRAFSYHELAEMFGEVPLVLATEPQNLPRADVDLIYGQIAYDLKNAIERFPATKYNTVESGHATKWAAQALMARVFLFYTGFYGKADLPLGDGAGENTGSVSKTEVTNWIEDCIANSGHSLVDDYRRLWAYSNQYTAAEFDYVKDLYDSGRTWVVDGTGNPEHVFVVKCSTMAGWGSETITGYSNMYLLFSGLRADNGGENTFPFGQGWGAGPVSSKLWREWSADEPNDMRRKASIIDVETETDNFIWGADKQVEETGYYVKKLSPARAHDSDGNLRFTFSSIMWSVTDDIALAHAQDHIVIRFADVLLMHSELSGNASGMNQVRARAGLPAADYSLEKLKKERRYELCFEGRRWADIRRWNDAATALADQEGMNIYNKTVATTMKRFAGGYAQRYEETKGFWPLPISEIDLSDGVLEQTPGWGSAFEYTGW